LPLFAFGSSKYLRDEGEGRCPLQVASDVGFMADILGLAVPWAGVFADRFPQRRQYLVRSCSPDAGMQPLVIRRLFVNSRREGGLPALPAASERGKVGRLGVMNLECGGVV
jgi:hypothetical protein